MATYYDKLTKIFQVGMEGGREGRRNVVAAYTGGREGGRKKKFGANITH